MRLKPIAIPLVRLVAFASFATLFTFYAFAADVTVTVDGVPNATGKVLVGLFNDAALFPKGKAVQGQKAPATKGSVVLKFADVAPGRYAVSVYHDQNDNGRLDANIVGMPTEPYGFSRNANGVMGPPKFDDAAVDVGAAHVSITIHLK